MNPMIRRRLLPLLALCGLALTPTLAPAQSADPIHVTVVDAMARPGDTLLVAVAVEGLAGREIIAGEVGVRFDSTLLKSVGVVRQGSLLENQRWLTASDVRDTTGSLKDVRLVYAAATGFVLDGDLMFLAFAVDSSAAIGSTTTLEVVNASFNNGEPTATLGAGTVSIVEEILDAAFIGRPRTGQVPLAVRFRDRTVGTAETWVWDFGDGGTSSEQNPEHDYLTEGNYAVSLTVTGPSGTSIEERDAYVVALPDETAPQIIAGPRVVGETQTAATVIWGTNEAASSHVAYATQRDFGDSLVAETPTLMVRHEVMLTDLVPATRYFFRVRSADAAGNISSPREGVFFTRRGADTRPPVITRGPSAAEITDVSARIQWRTNEAATSVVEYALGNDLTGAQQAESAALVEDHDTPIEGLQAASVYAYRVRSVDAAGNESRSRIERFRTLRQPDTDPPVILLGPVVIGRTNRAATIKLATNEPASVVVDYGTGTDYGLVETQAERQQLHRVRLTNLESNTLYHFQVTVTDAQGQSTTSADGEFVTRNAPDSRPPRIVLRPHAIGRFARRLVLYFETDEPCNATVEYGEDATYGHVASSEVEDRRHTVVLTDLAADAEVHYRVSITDASGNGPVASEPLVERTISEAEEATPLHIPQGPIVARRGEDQLTIGWKTNRPADSWVDYGVDDSRELRAGSAAPTKDHEVTLTDLTPGTVYTYSVSSTDPGDHSVTSENFTISTRAAADILAPFFTRAPQLVAVGTTEAHFEWQTNEPSDAVAEYGLDLNYGESELQEVFTEDHRFSLVGLTPGTLHHVRFLVHDAAGNGPLTSADIAFTTSAEADDRAPAIIAGPGVLNVTSTSATLGWRTDEPGDSFVHYGETEAIGSSTGDAALTRRHEQTLTNLTPGTVYHFVVASTDAAGNTATTDPVGNEPWSRSLSFRTRNAADTRPPVITGGPRLVVSNRGAVIEFVTDEPSIAELAYGRPADLDTPTQEVVFETEPARTHRLRIANLSAGARYVFRLKCRDAAGNELVVGTPRRGRAKALLAEGAADVGGALEFVTEETADTASPVITAGPILVSRTADTAIIEWATDEPADSFVDFGAADLASRVGDAGYVSEHRVFLTGLSPSTSYSYRVSSTDFTGNPAATSSLLTFATTSTPDLTPPQFVAAPQVLYADDSRAIVTWTTDEAASPLVSFGESLPDRVYFDDGFASEHSVQLTGLEPATTYQFQVTVTDPSSNTLQSELLSLTTTATTAAAAPQVSDVAVSGIGDVSAVVMWTTDVATNQFVFYGAGDSLDLAAGSTDYATEHRVVLTNLAPSTTYDFAVEAVDPAGNTSGRTAVATFTTAAEPDADAPPAPAAFDGLIGVDTARLSWSASTASDLANYTVYRDINGAGFQAVATGWADTTYTDEGLSFGSTYTYYVTASDIHGNESAPSSSDGGTVSIRNAPSSVVPVAAASAGSSTTLTVSNATPGSRGGPLTYTFHVSTSEVFDDVVASASGIAQGTAQTAWSFTKQLEAGRDYFWRARAFDGVFEGPWSFPSFFTAAGGSPGDFDGNGAVGLEDFFLFADAYGLGDAADAVYDLSADGSLGLEDFFLFADFYGTSYAGRPAGGPPTPGPGLEPTAVVTSYLEGDDVVVDIRSLVPVQGTVMRLGYDPLAVDVLAADASDFGVLQGLSRGEGLFARTEPRLGELLLFAHRLAAGPAANGDVARLRLRPRKPGTETWIELRDFGTIGAGGIRVLETPRRIAIRTVPGRFALHPAYPNPFNPETSIGYDLTDSGPVRLAVYDVLGQRVRTLVHEVRAAGRYREVWDGRDEAGRAVGTGAYFVSLVAGSQRAVTKVLLLR